MASTVGIKEITDRIISIMSGPEFETDLAAIRTKYGYSRNDLPQMTEQDRDVFDYINMGADSLQWPYLMVEWVEDEVLTWAKNNRATERATFNLIFGVEIGTSDDRLLTENVKAYIDAAKRTVTRAIRNNVAMVDARYVGGGMGATFSKGNSLVKFGTVKIVVDYYTTTETT